MDNYNIGIYIHSMKDISRFLKIMEKEKTIYVTQKGVEHKKISSKSLIGLCTFDLSNPLILLIDSEMRCERILKKLQKGGFKVWKNWNLTETDSRQ